MNDVEYKKVKGVKKYIIDKQMTFNNYKNISYSFINQNLNNIETYIIIIILYIQIVYSYCIHLIQYSISNICI